MQLIKKYILAVDQGTTSSRAILFDHDCNIAGIEQFETQQIYPKPGWVEQDPEEIWNDQLQVIKELLNKTGIPAAAVMAIGITNQRETTVVWDRYTGKAVYNAIIWQDKRTSGMCDRIRNSGLEPEIKEATGLVADPYFSATKIAWILENVPNARKNAEQGDLLFGTVDTWLAWKFSGGRLHITDASNASRTMLFNIRSGNWDQRMLEIFNIPEAMLPQVCDSSEIYGTTSSGIFGGTEIPIAGIAGDQQAALFGQNCFDAGMAKNTYGTGCFMLMNTGANRIISRSGLLTTVAWRLNGRLEYALEGSVFIAGAAIKWLRDALKIIQTAAESELLAIEAGNNNGVYFVPAFTGLGAPYWDMDARGIITGLTQGTDVRHIARAALESMAYQTRDVLGAMETDSGIALNTLKVDGGACVNDFLMQFQADMLGVQVERPAIVETTALGAAFLAGIASGFWKKEELQGKQRIEKVFYPQMPEEVRGQLYSGWIEAVSQVLKKKLVDPD